MKLQHTTILESIIKVLECGYISPPKRKNIKSWSKDYVFFSFVDNDEVEEDSIYLPLKAMKKYRNFFIHPTSNIYGHIDSDKFHYRALSEKQIKEYLNLFSEYDRNGDGYLTIGQLNKILKNELGLVPFKSKLKKFYFSEALYIIHKHYNCMCSWEYMSPSLDTKLQISKRTKEHKCRIKDLDDAITTYLVKNMDYCDGGNEIGFDNVIYVKDFSFITISTSSFKSLKHKDQEKLSKLLKVYKRRGLKIKLMP